MRLPKSAMQIEAGSQPAAAARMVREGTAEAVFQKARMSGIRCMPELACKCPTVGLRSFISSSDFIIFARPAPSVQARYSFMATLGGPVTSSEPSPAGRSAAVESPASFAIYCSVNVDSSSQTTIVRGAITLGGPAGVF